MTQPVSSRAARLSPFFAFAFCAALSLGFVSSASAEGLGGQQKPYELVVSKAVAKRGQPATVKVLFRAAKGWHINMEYPTSLKLTLPKAVTTPKPNLAKPDAKLTQQEGSFDVVLTASEAGAQTVPGLLSFAVCTETSCDPQKSPVEIALNVTP